MSNAKLRSKTCPHGLQQLSQVLSRIDLAPYDALKLHGLTEGAILDHGRRGGGGRSKRTRSDGVYIYIRQGKCRGGSGLERMNEETYSLSSQHDASQPDSQGTPETHGTEDSGDEED